jgi:hypothetical protein
VWSHDADDRPGAQIFPWETWERPRPWRPDLPSETDDDPPADETENGGESVPG